MVARLLAAAIVACVVSLPAYADSLRAGAVVCDTEASARVLRQENMVGQSWNHMVKSATAGIKLYQLLADTDLSLARAADADSAEQSKRLRTRAEALAKVATYSDFLRECAPQTMPLVFTALEERAIVGIAKVTVTLGGRPEIVWTSIEFISPQGSAPIRSR